MGKVFKGKLRVEASQVMPAVPAANDNILAVYKYDQTNTETLCITGEESTCVALTNSLDATYEKGTIVHYQVNGSESYYFHVLHDDGNTLTMQQRENTTSASWDSSGYNTQGPVDAITALESETSDWSNVNDQTYTMGTTVFGNASNAFTGCEDYNLCTTNSYTWSERTGKARMITLQEAAEQGCTRTAQSCPIYMSNNRSVYWTMSASYNADYAWLMGWEGINEVDGRVYTNYVTLTSSVRAVVVVNK